MDSKTHQYARELGYSEKLSTEMAEGVFQFDCEYCGGPSDYHPSEQEPPADYCWPEDHIDESLR